MIFSPSNNKKENKSPRKGGNHHGRIRTHGIIPIKMYKNTLGKAKKGVKYNK